jgi:succinyldiaminopimelate transaminase
MDFGRFDQLPAYPFPRLRALLGDVPPGQDPINLSIGEPQHPLPAFIPEILAAEAAGYGRYPPMEGTPALRAAIAAWLARRYRLPQGFIGAEKHVVPLNGTREGLFNAAVALSPATKAGRIPAVLIPNPFYQSYAGAAVAAGAKPVFVPARAETNFLPDFTALPEALLARASIIYLCSPANPQGTCASLAYWQALIGLARRHGILIFADECYAEIYCDTPPTGILEAAAQTGSLANVLAFHSLSKRSNAPGLRSGFAAGDETLIARFLAFRQYGGAPLPLPVQAASAAAWAEESHVEANRALYRAKFDMAARVLGNRLGFYRPQGGFYLWLDVGDGEAAALTLWREAGVRVLPGRYLGHDQSPGDPKSNPGYAFIRIALVSDEATTQTALRRIAQCL